MVISDLSYRFPAAAPALPAGFEQPKSVDAAILAFPAHVVGTLLPHRGDIPREFRESSRPSRELFARWFFEGLRGAEFTPRPGVDRDAALRHISACMRSFEPSHENKEEGVAFLLESFFLRVDVPAAKSGRAAQ